MYGHKITKLSTPTDPSDAATKEYVDKKAENIFKPIITVWAEEVGPIAMGHAEWSFGDQGSGASHRRSGYCMPVSGYIIRMSLTSVTQRGEASDEVIVNLSINGATQNKKRNW